MARAICMNCGVDFYWYGGRGCKVAHIKSPCCKARAVGMTSREGKAAAQRTKEIHVETSTGRDYCWRGFMTAGLDEQDLIIQGSRYKVTDETFETEDDLGFTNTGDKWRRVILKTLAPHGNLKINLIRENDYQILLAQVSAH